MKSTFTIGDLSREFGVTLRTLRFYEDKQLLNPKRHGLNRLYSRRDRARLKLVLMGKKVGFSLTEIKDMLDLYDLKDGQVTQLKVALAKFDKQIDPAAPAEAGHRAGDRRVVAHDGGGRGHAARPRGRRSASGGGAGSGISRELRGAGDVPLQMEN